MTRYSRKSFGSISSSSSSRSKSSNKYSSSRTKYRGNSSSKKKTCSSTKYSKKCSSKKYCSPKQYGTKKSSYTYRGTGKKMKNGRNTKTGTCNRPKKSKMCKTGPLKNSRVKYTTGKKTVYKKSRELVPRMKNGKCPRVAKQTREGPGSKKSCSKKSCCYKGETYRKGKCRVTEKARKERCSSKKGYTYVRKKCLKQCENGQRRSKKTNRCVMTNDCAKKSCLKKNTTPKASRKYKVR